MARLNVYVPDDLAAAAREAGLNVSALTQQALKDALQRHATDVWLEQLGTSGSTVTREQILDALDEAREERDV